MASNASRGTYYRQRTKRWLEERGYVVAQLERMHMIAPGVFTKKDQLGADLLAINRDHVLFVQVKMGGARAKTGTQMTKAKREFELWPVPLGSEQWIVVWEPGAHDPRVYRRPGDGGEGWYDPPVEQALHLRRTR
jgi:hypothetical protein